MSFNTKILANDMISTCKSQSLQDEDCITEIKPSGIVLLLKPKLSLNQTIQPMN